MAELYDQDTELVHDDRFGWLTPEEATNVTRLDAGERPWQPGLTKWLRRP